jgi:hypothetical protein
MRISIVIICCLLIPASTYGQTPDYFTNDPKWVCGLWSSNQWNPPYIESTSIYVYYLNGDSVIGNYTYHRLFSKGKTTYFGPIPTVYFDNFTGYFLRQENNSIRFYTNQIGTDSLLISYDYQVGDTVKGDIFQGCGFDQDTIQKIDSILVNSEYRKVFYLDSITGPVITEGIGHQLEININGGEFILMLCQGIGFAYMIHCFGYGTTAYWDSQGTGGNCILSVGVEEYDGWELMVYPNPFNTYLNIKSTPNETSEIIIYDVASRIVLVKKFKNELQIPTQFLDNGIYFYEIRNGYKVIKNGKILKNENLEY